MTRVVYFLFCLIIFNITSCGIFKKNPKKPSNKVEKPSSGKRALLEKYSKILGEEVDDEKLYGFIDAWMGVPYKFGGKTKTGVDCSNFTCELLRQVYAFPSTFYFPSSKLAEQGQRINKNEAKEGDLIFFSINQNSKISHVGIYLTKNKFVHASTGKGVIINSLDEDYYKKRVAFLSRIKK
jgi:lipoprotein Spr